MKGEQWMEIRSDRQKGAFLTPKKRPGDCSRPLLFFSPIHLCVSNV